LAKKFKSEHLARAGMSQLTSIHMLRCRYLEQTAEFVGLHDGYYKLHKVGLEGYASGGGIEHLPTIERQTAQRHPRDFFCRTDLPCTMYFTGGTSGPPLALFRSAAEQEALANMLAALFVPPPRKLATLALEGFNHGETLPSQVEQLFTAPLIVSSHYKNALEFMGQGIVFPTGDCAVEVLRTSALTAKALFQFASENELDFGNSLQTIVTTSSHLTRHWKDRIRSFAKCDIKATYGLTEFCEGIAWECPACSCFHFPPSVFPELDGEEIGELIMSSLYPFSQVQLFLRYRTGDLFRRHNVCSLYDDHGYSFIGRVKDCAMAADKDGQRAWLSPVAIAEVLDAVNLGSLAQHADLQAVLGAPAPGRRLFEIETRDNKLVVRIAAQPGERTDLSDIADLILKQNFVLTGLELPTRLTVETHDVRSIVNPAIY
jgi:hypothetical protein